MGRYRPAVMADPYTALLRDCIVDGPNAKPTISERDITQAAEQQLQALEQVRSMDELIFALLIFLLTAGTSTKTSSPAHGKYFKRCRE